MRKIFLFIVISLLLSNDLLSQEMTLQECIAFAQKKSDAAKVADKEFIVNILNYQGFKASYLPQVSLNGSGPGLDRSIKPAVLDDGSQVFRAQNSTYSNVNLNVTQKLAIFGTEISLGSSISRIDQFGDNSNSYYSTSPINLQVRQPLFKVNTYKWDNKIRDMEYENMKKRYSESMESIAIKVTSKFFDLYISEMNIKNATRNKLDNDTLFMLSQGRYKVGKIAENDLLQSELEKLKSELALESAYLEYERVLEEFKILIGLRSHDTVSIIPETTFEMFEVDPKVAMNEALKNRSDITYYKINEERARRNLEVTEDNNTFTADFRATFGLNKSAGDVTDAYREMLDQESVNFTFSVPLFQWGKGDSEIEAAYANMERVEIDNRQSRKEFETQVKFQTLRFKQLQKQVLIAAKSDTIANKRFDVSYKRFRIGKIDMNDLFIAQNEKNQAFQSYISTLKNYWVAYYQLRQTTLYDFKTESAIEYNLSAFK